MTNRDTPFDGFERMVDQMRRAMLGMGNVGFEASMHPEFDWGRKGGFDANVSMESVEDSYVVYADLPGFEKEEIDLRYDDGMLSIEGIHEIADDDGEGYQRRHVHERISIPGDVREDEISATYRNGVLKVSLPTDEEPEDDAHHIDIE